MKTLQEKISRVQNLKARAAEELAIELDIKYRDAWDILDRIVEEVVRC